MNSLYEKGSVFWERFPDPLGYLSIRRQVEQLLFGFLTPRAAVVDGAGRGSCVGRDDGRDPGAPRRSRGSDISFTQLNEITAIVAEKGLPGEGWETRIPAHFAHYIEAQVWNAEALEDYQNSTSTTPPGS